MSDIAARKAQHLSLAMDEGSQVNSCQFDSYQLPVRSLPEIDLKDVDTSSELFGKKLRQPLIIASMTGGSLQGTEINKNLAIAAEKCRVALGVGSQRAALEKPEMRATFEVVRKYAPKAVVFANMGAVQLNYGHAAESYKRVVDMVEADGLYLHINAMQEALQPEGDTNFKFLISKIELLIKNIGVPVFVKEVGNGIDGETVKRLIGMGVAGIDVAGVGGTSWTWIEAKRANNANFVEWFKDWGTTTEEAVRVSVSVRGDKNCKVIASGGIRNPIQGLKAHLLGADYYSAARPFLEKALISDEETVKLVSDWEKGLRIAMFGCGRKKW
jgi:isopentenyl-diphosphate delta-isomerase